MSAVEVRFEIPLAAYHHSNGGDVLMMHTILSKWADQLPEIQEDIAATELFQIMAPHYGVAAVQGADVRLSHLTLVE